MTPQNEVRVFKAGSIFILWAIATVIGVAVVALIAMVSTDMIDGARPASIEKINEVVKNDCARDIIAVRVKNGLDASKLNNRELDSLKGLCGME